MNRFPTYNSFQASPAGRRAARRFQSFFAQAAPFDAPVVRIGPAAFFDESVPDGDIFQTAESVAENAPLPSLGDACSAGTVFIAALNDGVFHALPPLIKESARVLKPAGRLILIVKNAPSLCPAVGGVPSSRPFAVRRELARNGLRTTERRDVLHIPFYGKAGDIADKILYTLNVWGGGFTVFTARKAPFVPQRDENYSSARMTSASVFTSPRT